KNYQPTTAAGINFEDSQRIERLIRAGHLYLSLRDAIALALENNLDIETARLTPKLQQSNLRRASAGALLRNVSSSITNGPSSASLGVLAGANSLGTTSTASSTNGTGGVLSGLSVQLAGSAIPNLDPTVFVSAQFQHQTSPLTSTFTTGTNFTLYLSNTLAYKQNSPNSDFNPVDQGSLNFSITQNLLNGFGVKVNNRAIRIAKNQLHLSDLSFKQQVIATVNNVVGLYWDLVSFNDSLKVKQQTLELN